VLPMINEAARILDEGIVDSPGSADLGMIMGTGFPPFRGGLLRYADSLGTAAIVDRLQELTRELGPRFEPAPLLVQYAAEGRTFYE
jgi:3-hydroxyacyl-CoA dehydrogenase